jgi:hypothetical protein
MPTFDVDREEITAFELDGRYIFKQYFDNDDLFQELEHYYNSDNYRFEVPDWELSEVRQILDNYFYELETVDNIADYCVVQPKEADSSTIHRNAVASQRHGNHDIFLMKDKLSVRQAVEQGAFHSEKSDLKMEGIQWKIDGS